MARQKFGQHFLVRGSLLERIARAACPSTERLVVEIGPGRGALTQKLLERSERVVAIEIDPFLVEHLRRKFAAEPRLEVVEADVLATDLAQWGTNPIAGNLPYYIASPIIERTLRMAPPRAVFLVQEEVAQRLSAAPGSRDYGFLTVQTALFARATRLFGVPPAAFHPPPKVDSAVVLLEPHRAPALAGDDADAFLRFVSQAFAHKRKTLRNNLADTWGRELIDTWPEAALRAEQIPFEGFVDLWSRVRKQNSPRRH